VRGYEDNLGEPLRAVREDVEKEWVVKLEEEVKKREEKEAWASELVRQLEKEKKVSSCMLPCFFVILIRTEHSYGRRLRMNVALLHLSSANSIH
jgi:hypothetical protein